jgi:hypothetical protein
MLRRKRRMKARSVGERGQIVMRLREWIRRIGII